MINTWIYSKMSYITSITLKYLIMIIFYNRLDEKMEAIGKTDTFKNRLDAAKYFSRLKRLPLKEFIKIFGVVKLDKN